MKRDYRDMSIGEAIAWGLAPGMSSDEIEAEAERSQRRARWERRKARK